MVAWWPIVLVRLVPGQRAVRELVLLCAKVTGGRLLSEDVRSCQQHSRFGRSTGPVVVWTEVLPRAAISCSRIAVTIDVEEAAFVAVQREDKDSSYYLAHTRECVRSRHCCVSVRMHCSPVLAQEEGVMKEMAGLKSRTIHVKMWRWLVGLELLQV